MKTGESSGGAVDGSSYRPSLHQSQKASKQSGEDGCAVQSPLGISISGLDGTRPLETVEQISLYPPSQQL